MGLLGRRRRDRDDPPPVPEDEAESETQADAQADAVLPALTRVGAAELTRLARETFAAHGVETVADGRGALVAVDGRVHGLANLSATVAPEPRTAWPALIERHVAGLVASEGVAPPLSLDDVRHRVYPRLRWAGDLPHPAPTYPPQPLPGVVELAAIDHPDHVAELLSDEAVERLGGWPAAREVAMTNLRALPPMHHDTVRADPQRDDASVHVLTTDDFFGPSRLLVLPELLPSLGIERPSHGVLVVVPNRHLLAVHALAGPGVVAALQVLARIGTGEHDTPGAVSRHVYYLSADGAPAQQVTSVSDDGTLSVTVDGALAAAFVALGLLGR
jgi:hypothetical protein